jgi:chloramphenicol-sensitive protein RarD
MPVTADATVPAEPAQRPGQAPVHAEDRVRAGFAYGLGAYVLWGFLPMYFKLLGRAQVPPLAIVAHRVVWSVLFLAVLLTAQRRWADFWSCVRNRRALATLLCSSVLIAANWFLFIWATVNGQLVQGSLAYFINPLMNVLLGVVFLKERLRLWQVLSLSLAAGGVVVLAVAQHAVPTLALVIAATFALYAFVRKVTPAGPLVGLSIETALLLPAALWLLTPGVTPASFGSMVNIPGGGPTPAGTYALLSLSGVMTAVPLLLFATAAKQLRLATLGVLQYISPTIAFILAVAVYKEPFSSGQLAGFALIWVALAVYTADSIRAKTGARRCATDAEAMTAAVGD